ncbi:MAG TPA: helix-turn-helix domain-containing protein [Anaerovoracaceae bacterium]|nr:helix-turn-helix domain-containing protein [Anaerovoracaceae bacterium]
MDTSEKKTYDDCPINYTLSVIGGKWKLIILTLIARDEVVRYGKLKDGLLSIAHKTLSQQLKELEEDGIIHREQYNQVPPKVGYTLTEKGKSLIPILDLMAQWGVQNRTNKLSSHNSIK